MTKRSPPAQAEEGVAQTSRLPDATEATGLPARAAARRSRSSARMAPSALLAARTAAHRDRRVQVNGSAARKGLRLVAAIVRASTGRAKIARSVNATA